MRQLRLAHLVVAPIPVDLYVVKAIAALAAIDATPFTLFSGGEAPRAFARSTRRRGSRPFDGERALVVLSIEVSCYTASIIELV